MPDRLIKMIAFVKTVELGSFSAAAAHLSMSPQIVGRHVNGLERRFGTQLLKRTTRKQSLTEAGRLYFDACKRAIEAIEDADEIIVATTTVPKGILRVTAPAEVGAAVLAPRLPHFLALYPDLRVELDLTDRAVDLIEENFDVAIRIGTLNSSGLVARALIPFRLVTCASPAYLEKKGTPVSPDELSQHECLDYTFHHYPSPSNWTFTQADQEMTFTSNARLAINDGNALVNAALAGAGIIRTSELAVRAFLHSGRLVRVLPDFQSADRPMQVVYPSLRYRLPKLRVFIDWLVKEMHEAGAGTEPKTR